jgi:arsenate reductase
MAINYLQAKSIEFETVLYLEKKLTINDLESILRKLNLSASELLRKGEEVYKVEIKGKNISDAEIIQLMIKHPNLIERPIIINGNKAVIGRPTELIDKIL